MDGEKDYSFLYLNNQRVQIKAKSEDLLNELQTAYSYQRKVFGNNYAMASYGGTAIYSCISPTFSIKKGLTLELARHVISQGNSVFIDPKLKPMLQPPCSYVNSDESLVQPNASFTYRDYQERAIRSVKKHGRGILSSPTSSGKSLILFGVCSNIKEFSERTLIIVPRIQLVSQFYKEWTVEYGYKGIAMYSTKNPTLDPNARVVITNYQFLVSKGNGKRKDIELIKNGGFKAVIVDECHTIGESGSWLSNFLMKLDCQYAIGCTGTVPDDKAKRWNIIGVLGPVIFVEHVKDLQDRNQIAKIHIKCFKFNHNLRLDSELPWKVSGSLIMSKETGELLSTTEMYRAEYGYIEHHDWCNDYIIRFAEKLEGNTVILVDHIDHANYLFENCKAKNKHLVTGATKLESRNDLSTLVDSKKDDHHIIVAVASCFSTGISIKNLNNLILCSHGKALTKIIQSLGRVLRKTKKDGEEEYGNLYDFSHNQMFAKKHFKSRCTLYKKFYAIDVSKKEFEIKVPEGMQNSNKGTVEAL